MIVDTSALVAILLNEPERAAFIAHIKASAAAMSAASYVELAAVVDRRNNPLLSRRLDEVIGALGIEICSVDQEQAKVARRAYAEYGRGSGSPARLNFGDCFSYALARTRNQPLLYKGDDFSHTDLAQ